MLVFSKQLGLMDEVLCFHELPFEQILDHIYFFSYCDVHEVHGGDDYDSEDDSILGR